MVGISLCERRAHCLSDKTQGTARHPGKRHVFDRRRGALWEKGKEAASISKKGGRGLCECSCENMGEAAAWSAIGAQLRPVRGAHSHTHICGHAWYVLARYLDGIAPMVR